MIIIFNNFEILVDDDFNEKITNVLKNKKTYYVNSGSTYLHRKIMNASKGQVVDHINGNGLDNRRENLRFCTIGQNRQRSPVTQGKSKLRGVSMWRGKFQSKIWFNGKCIHLGTFGTEIEAAKRYNIEALKFFGEHAFINKCST